MQLIDSAAFDPESAQRPGQKGRAEAHRARHPRQRSKDPLGSDLRQSAPGVSRKPQAADAYELVSGEQGQDVIARSTSVDHLAAHWMSRSPIHFDRTNASLAIHSTPARSNKSANGQNIGSTSAPGKRKEQELSVWATKCSMLKLDAQTFGGGISHQAPGSQDASASELRPLRGPAPGKWKPLGLKRRCRVIEGKGLLSLRRFLGVSKEQLRDLQARILKLPSASQQTCSFPSQYMNCTQCVADSLSNGCVLASSCVFRLLR